ncbi:MAG: Yip1 protein [Gemmatimonadetes bacterium]|nr:Yip1 protein [Gemmatimonadota bacterium]
MSDASASDTATPVPPTKQAARWEDFLDIFYAPASVFARRINSGWTIPLLVVVILSALIFVANTGVMQPLMDAEFTRGMAAAMKKNPSFTPEMAEKARGITEKFAILIVILGLPVSIFCVGVFLWVIGKLFDARQTLSAALMVAAYSYMPRVVEGVLAGVQGLLMDPSTLTGRLKLSLGVGRFLDPDGSPVMLAALGRIDVFTIWITILLGIGLSVTGRISRQKAFLAAALVWVLGGAFMVLSAMRNS